ncbi:hypothetical protein [Nitratireductor indicus]|uniref:hypothetical protein n=1 Tax=Nitratireductor indicus TaxID=721133 RepID=UPI002875125C|nr:hypothetical protein [Nitratireductor indicus]MDS1138594.1 hypothetical protein [Nitratireductor indicus]
MRKVRTPEPEMFCDFWSVWQPIARHTDGRGLARETFRKHILNGAEPQDIIDGAKWFVRSLTDRDRDFVPLSSTWINREAYLDFCEKERAYQARIAEMEHQRDNVVQMQRASLPENHFSRRYERGEFKREGNA